MLAMIGERVEMPNLHGPLHLILLDSTNSCLNLNLLRKNLAILDVEGYRGEQLLDTWDYHGQNMTELQNKLIVHI